ncbi:MAG: hypothetical protein NCA08_05260 [Deltaproteobacteria bacterium]|nr:hypothetical protein [Candidatus Deferrimicrobium borealis]
MEETYDSAYRLLKDQSIGSGYRFMFVIDDIALNPTQEEMSVIVSLISSLRTCFNGRMAIVAARSGLQTASHMVALAVNRASGMVQSFTNENSARAWLLADIPSCCLKSEI